MDFLTSSFFTSANAAEVRINGVGMVDPWDGAKGEVTVDYSLLGLEADIRYKVMFEFTANGRTVSVTNDAAGFFTIDVSVMKGQGKL